MELLIGFWVLLFIVFICLFYASDWCIHKSMVKESCEKYRKINFKEFRRLFDETRWWKSRGFGKSLFGVYNYETKNYINMIHASIFQFNYEGVILKTPHQYNKAVKYIEYHLKNNNYKYED